MIQELFGGVQCVDWVTEGGAVVQQTLAHPRLRWSDVCDAC